MAARGLADVAFGCEFGFFQIAENFLGTFEHSFRDAGQTRDLDAVAFVGAAFDDFAQKNDLIVPFANGGVEVFEARQAAGEFGEFVVMRCEQGFCADLVMQVFDDAPGQAEAVEGAGATSDFIEDDETARGGVVEDVGGFAHFDHESGLAPREVVARANAGEDAVHEIDASFARRNERTSVRENCEQGGLADVSAFAGHVGAGDEGNSGFVIEARVVGNKAFVADPLFENGMAPVANDDHAFIRDLRAAIVLQPRDFGE